MVFLKRAMDYDGAGVQEPALGCQSDLRLVSDVRHAQCTNHPTDRCIPLSFYNLHLDTLILATHHAVNTAGNSLFYSLTFSFRGKGGTVGNGTIVP